MSTYLVLVQGPDGRLRGDIRRDWHDKTGTAGEAVTKSFHAERDAAGTYHLHGDLHTGDHIVVLKVTEARHLEIHTHRPTLPADAWTEA